MCAQNAIFKRPQRPNAISYKILHPLFLFGHCTNFISRWPSEGRGRVYVPLVGKHAFYLLRRYEKFLTQYVRCPQENSFGLLNEHKWCFKHVGCGIYGEKSILNIVESKKIVIVITIFRFPSHQTEFRLVANKLENCHYTSNLFWFNKIQNQFICTY